MTNYNSASIYDTSLAFNPLADVIVFNGGEDATSVELYQSSANVVLWFFAAGSAFHTITLTGVDLRALDSANLNFGSTTHLRIGDQTHGTAGDDAGNVMSFTGSDHGRLFGLDGNDTLTALSGTNVLEGGAGNDTLTGGVGVDAASYIDAASGVHVSLLVVGAQNTFGAGTDTLVGFEKLIGSQFADTLIAGAAGSTLNGLNGGDDLVGGAGSDILNGGGASDFADYSLATAGVTVNLTTSGFQNTGGAGSDMLVSIEKLSGSGFGDTLTGDSGANALYGNAGNDVLTGGAGQDILAGGGGGDSFVFTTIGDSTVAAPDTILDFQAGDHIDLSGIDADTATGGDQAFHLGATVGHTGDIVVGPFANGHTEVDLYVNGDATPDAAIWLNGNHTGLTAGDFVL